MRALNRFLTLSRSDRALVISAAVALASAWLGLRLFPFHTMLKRADTFSRRNSFFQSDLHPAFHRVVWAVLAVSKYAPLTMNCLVQALAAKALLNRAGYPTLIRIGVAASEDGKLHAHAWLERDGEIVIGGAGSERYRPLPVFDWGPK